VLEEHGLLYEDYETQDDIFRALDEIAHDWLLNDLSDAEVKDLAEIDPEVRKTAPNASAIRAKIHGIELKMQELDPQYMPSVYSPMRIEDWNPPRAASAQDFYKEFAYYFGDDISKIDEAARLCIRFHPEAEIDQVKQAMTEGASGSSIDR